MNGYNALDYRFLYFLDADEEGVETRLSEVSDLLSLPNQLEHYEVIKKDNYEISCCIFYNSYGSGRSSYWVDLSSINL